MIVVSLYQRVPQITVGRILYSIQWFQARIDRLPKHSNHHNVALVQLNPFMTIILALTNQRFTLHLLHPEEFFELLILQRHQRTDANCRFIQRGSLRQVLFEYQSELLLLLHPCHLFAEPRSQVRVVNFLYQVTYY